MSPSRALPLLLLPALFLAYLALPAAPAHALEKEVMGDVVVERSETEEDVSTFWGDVVVEGEVEEDVVSSLGSVEVRAPVGGDVEAGWGDVSVDARVEGDLHVGHGDVRLGPDAVVVGDISAGNGRLDQEPGAEVMGEVKVGMASDFGGDSPFDAAGALVWGIVTLGFAAAAILLAVAAPRPLRASARCLEEAPWRSLAIGVASVPVAVVGSVVLAFTGVGLLLLPLAWPAYLALVLFGAFVAAYHLGRRVVLATGRYRAGDTLAAIVGALLVSAASLIPILGGLVLAALVLLGTGAALSALLARRRAKRPTYASYEEYLKDRRE